ncbi:2-amino-4-hydroxy-6-hydroxymethyldihydropteridine diphosphokinase [Gordonia soli]|uniref:2-amino-4-hydroxy-6-hydroxymethyldihydropteridine diphosphokinase n=1 Tax=Gordonia soli NBRC 108243 TaxID=1223545 RepID=M0QL32_9ACTN|nr:2-amino-4-hydroxy-6-hydroxymethyldihydropteridine diphosphokinase [Gordonia soli]GAC68127.1 2-amino-4-hydroxy-6-hydroxymethyldihydropteridine pyrophosphokinase [Gordonia soli NBRC 108243]
MSRAVLSAGSNVGDRAAHLRAVVDRFGDEVVAVSPIHVTAPWGGVEQDDFYNITLVVEADRTPRDWLDIGRELEREAERTREIRWGPRTLDVDVISVDIDQTTVVDDDPELTLPHPRAAQRAFVLIPWLAADPDATLWTPDGVRSVSALLAALDEDERDGVTELGPTRSGVAADSSSDRDTP